MNGDGNIFNSVYIVGERLDLVAVFVIIGEGVAVDILIQGQRGAVGNLDIVHGTRHDRYGKADRGSEEADRKAVASADCPGLLILIVGNVYSFIVDIAADIRGF